MMKKFAFLLHLAVLTTNTVRRRTVENETWLLQYPSTSHSQGLFLIHKPP